LLFDLVIVIVRVKQQHFDLVIVVVIVTTRSLVSRSTAASVLSVLQVSENWKKSGYFSGQGKVRGKYFLEKSGKMKSWCHQMSDF